MTRTVSLVAITLISALATPMVVNATTPKPRAAVPPLTTLVPQTAIQPACARPVRVVYAGYGEGQSAACTALVR
jgi:hypothetical protein